MAFWSSAIAVKTGWHLVWRQGYDAFTASLFIVKVLRGKYRETAQNFVLG
ncbi:hypothetical protein [Leptolyngbya sp. PCC 6406]|nr:hypothetical protein [Leptolyngbya sp. PCC 6406]